MKRLFVIPERDDSERWRHPYIRAELAISEFVFGDCPRENLPGMADFPTCRLLTLDEILAEPDGPHMLAAWRAGNDDVHEARELKESIAGSLGEDIGTLIEGGYEPAMTMVRTFRQSISELLRNLPESTYSDANTVTRALDIDKWFPDLAKLRQEASG